MTIQLPDPDDLTYRSITPEARQVVRDWIDAFQSNPFHKPVGQWISKVANHVGKSPKTVRAKYDQFRKTGSWSVFVPKHKIPKSALQIRTRNQAFRNHLATLAENHQRNSKAAIRKLKRAWKNREIIPAYDDFQGWPAFPEGWSDRNLDRIIQEECDARTLQAVRHGTSSKTNYLLPHVHLTRVGLYPGAVYQIDDVWHDNFVTLGYDPHPVRVLELGVLDLFSGCRFHWGSKPRVKVDGKHENLKEKEMRFFLAAFLLQYGYSDRGTQLMVEHGTAAVREDVERILYDDTGGKITTVRQPIEGGQQALNNYWPGSEGGNFRAKAALESLHARIHNDLSNLRLQTGKNKDSRPVTTDRQLQYISRIIKDVAKVNPGAVQALLLPSMDFHREFVPFLNDYYRHGLNARTDHRLEGWAELGHLVTEYTMLPGSDQFLSAEQFLALPDVSRQLLTESARNQPAQFTRKRNLSPAEVFYPAVPKLRKLAPHTLCDILSQDLAREVTVRGSFIEFQDKDIAPEPLIYKSQLLTIEGNLRELRSGEKLNAFANPFAPRWLFVTDAKGTCLGQCELVKKVAHTDHQGIQRAAGEKRARIADILEPTRQRHTEEVRQVNDMREHNRRVLAGEETDPHRRRIAGAEQAQVTRRGNRVESHAETLRDDHDLAAAFASSPVPEPPEDDEEFDNPFV
jgi:hypothetical protein